MASSIDASTSGAGGVITTADNSGSLDLKSGGTTIATVSSTGLSLATGKTLSVGGVTGSPYTMKNRIINGAMLIDQRNAGTVLTCSAGANTYTIDRWQVENSTSSATCTAQQVSGNANTSQGYSQSLRLIVGTTGSATAAQVINLVQKIEGFNVQDLAWGTANAKSITVSFWVYSSLIGTYCSTIRNSNGRSYTVEYSIPVANTWTQITYTVAGDTTTSLATDNTFSLGLYFDLGSGSNFNTTAGAWQTGNYRRTTNQVNWINTSAATFYITGVQLEVGSSATSFEWRPYGMELRLCQRYYETSGASAAWSGVTVSGSIYYAQNKFQVAKRTSSPSISNTNAGNVGFSTTASTANNMDNYGFLNYRTSNGAANGGYFQDTWKATDEL